MSENRTSRNLGYREWIMARFTGISAERVEIRRGQRVLIFWEKYGILVAFLLVCALFGVLSPFFLTPTNIFNVIRQVSIIGVLAVGMTFVILTAGIDLSVGSVLAFAGMVAAYSEVRMEWGVGASVALPLLTGLLAGLANGFISTKGRIHPFVVTLGAMSIFRGASLLLAGGRPISGVSKPFRFIGGGEIGPLPVPVIIFLGMVIVAHIVLTRTKFGRAVYATGGNAEAARLSGINIDRIKITAFGICGCLAALGGIILTSRLNSGELTAGIGYELDVIASVIIGGTSLFGGEGSVYGTLIGAMLIGVLSNGLNLLEVPSFWQMIIRGTIIVLAVLLDGLKRRLR